MGFDRARSSGSIYPANTSLLLRVEVPAAGYDVLLSFGVKPGLPLEQVQQGITEVIDELAYRLGTFLNEKDLQSNADKYEVAKLECEEQLQDWQSKLSEATLAVLRADRSRSELSKLRESYWREVQNLRQQLHRKRLAEERGQEFVPASVDLFSSKEAASEFNDMFLEQMNRMEDEHQAEIAAWKQKNALLLKKMKSKVRGVEVPSCDVEVQTASRDFVCDVSCGPDEPVSTTSTSFQTYEFEGISVNNFLAVKEPSAETQAALAPRVQSVDSEIQTEVVWPSDCEACEDPAQWSYGESQMKARSKSLALTELPDQSFKVDDSDSDESDESDEDLVLESCQMEKSWEDPDLMVTESEAHTDGENSAVPILPHDSRSPRPTLLGMSCRPQMCPANPPTSQRRRFARPQLQIKTSDDSENQSPGPGHEEKTGQHLSPPAAVTRAASHDSKRTRLPGLKGVDSDSRSPPIRRSSLTFGGDKDITFPVCSKSSTSSSETPTGQARPAQRTISRPRLTGRRLSSCN